MALYLGSNRKQKINIINKIINYKDFENITYNESDNTITLIERDGTEHTILCTYENDMLIFASYDGEEINLGYENDNLVSIGDTDIDLNTFQSVKDFQNGFALGLISKGISVKTYENPLKYIDSFYGLFGDVVFADDAELIVPLDERRDSIGSMFSSAQNIRRVIFVGTAPYISCDTTFYNCQSLVEVDFSQVDDAIYVADMIDCFNNCTSLIRVKGVIDGTNNFNLFTFDNCPSLEEVNFKANTIQCDISMPDSPKLSATCIQNIIDGFSSDSPCYWYVHSDIYNSITESQWTQIFDKGWSVVES